MDTSDMKSLNMSPNKSEMERSAAHPTDQTTQQSLSVLEGFEHFCKAAIVVFTSHGDVHLHNMRLNFRWPTQQTITNNWYFSASAVSSSDQT